MKALLALALLTTSLQAIADDNTYCSDETKKVFVVRSVEQGTLHRRDVERGEVVATLNNGSVVIVSCYGNVVIDKNSWRIDSYIVSGDKVFTPVVAKSVGDSTAIGINTDGVLVEQNKLLIKKYIIIPRKK